MEVSISDQIFFFLFATRHYNFRFTVDSYCLLLHSLLASSFMSQVRILLTRLINGIVPTSLLSFCDHESRHRYSSTFSAPSSRALVPVALSRLPFFLYSLQPPLSLSGTTLIVTTMDELSHPHDSS
ncbi:hypothetical protein JHK85_042993 [Glycine max]|nr:hypothetical protein JHK85_042993 [Glycine max]